MTIGDMIKIARQEAGLTQTQLAERLDIPFQSISQWERGKRQPKKESLQRIALALGLDSDFFLSAREEAIEFSRRNFQFDSVARLLMAIYGGAVWVQVEDGAASSGYYRIGKNGKNSFILYPKQFSALFEASETVIKSLISVMTIETKTESEVQQEIFNDLRTPEHARTLLHKTLDSFKRQGESLPFTHEDVDKDPVGLYETVFGDLPSQPIVHVCQLDTDVQTYLSYMNADDHPDTSKPQADHEEHEEPTEQKEIDWGPPAGEEIW